jgi:hypothetical protein
MGKFLDLSTTFMNVNALDPGWEDRLVRNFTTPPFTEGKLQFRRGFAKSVLGQLTLDEYEESTGWDFETDEEFRAHLWKYWRLLYGNDDPAAELQTPPGV